MDFAVRIALPLLTVLLMVAVGLELALDDFRRVVRRPRAVLVGTLGQLILLPLIGLMIVASLSLPPHVAGGLLLIAACPGGALSNFLTYLARANTALSVSMTVISCLLAFLAVPLLTAATFEFVLQEEIGVEVPVVRMMSQLFLLLVLPVSAGMMIRHWSPRAQERLGTPLRRISVLAVLALVGFVIYAEWARVSSGIVPAAVAALLFTLLAMAAGLGVGWIARLEARDLITFLIEFSTRNLAIAVVVGAAILGRLDFMVFATVFFVVRTPIVLAVIGLYRRAHRTAPPESLALR